MSKEQEKLKWYEIRRIYLFICILFILLMIAGFSVVAFTEPNITTCRECAYDSAKIELQNAVNDYQNKNNGAVPTINGTVTVNGSLCHIIDICALLVSEGGKLNQVPDGYISINGSDNDNCDAGCTGCWEYSHYIWAVDDEGDVYSTCIGDYCNASGVDGYQDVWP